MRLIQAYRVEHPRLMMADLRRLLDRQGIDFWGNSVMLGRAKRQPDGSVKMEFSIGQGPRVETMLSHPAGPGGVSRSTGVFIDGPKPRPYPADQEDDAIEGRFVKQPPDPAPNLIVMFKTARGNSFTSKGEWY